MVTSFSNLSAFWGRVYPQVQGQASLCNLFLGLLSRFRDEPEKCGFAAIGEHEGQFGAILLSHHLTEKILVPTPTQSELIVSELLGEYFRTEISPTAIVCEEQTSKLYASALTRRGAELTTHMEQGVYRCNEVNCPEIPEPLNFREAVPGDLSLMQDWIECFYKEAAPADPEMDYAEVASRLIRGGRLFVVEKDNEPVSMAATLRNFESYASVGGVYTPKNQRGNGYGSLVTALLTKKLLVDGKSEVSLFTDLSNPTSNRIYQNIGYELVGRSIHMGIQFN